MLFSESIFATSAQISRHTLKLLVEEFSTNKNSVSGISGIPFTWPVETDTGSSKLRVKNHTTKSTKSLQTCYPSTHNQGSEKGNSSRTNGVSFTKNFEAVTLLNFSKRMPFQRRRCLLAFAQKYLSLKNIGDSFSGPGYVHQWENHALRQSRRWSTCYTPTWSHALCSSRAQFGNRWKDCFWKINFPPTSLQKAKKWLSWNLCESKKAW